MHEPDLALCKNSLKMDKNKKIMSTSQNQNVICRCTFGGVCVPCNYFHARREILLAIQVSVVVSLAKHVTFAEYYQFPLLANSSRLCLMNPLVSVMLRLILILIQHHQPPRHLSSLIRKVIVAGCELQKKCWVARNHIYLIVWFRAG